MSNNFEKPAVGNYDFYNPMHMMGQIEFNAKKLQEGSTSTVKTSGMNLANSRYRGPRPELKTA